MSKMTKSMRGTLLAASAAVIAVTGAQSARAQDTPAEEPNDYQLGEIVVTAQ